MDMVMVMVCVCGIPPASLVPPPFFARLFFRQLKRAPPAGLPAAGSASAALLPAGLWFRSGAVIASCCATLLRYPAAPYGPYHPPVAPINLRRTIAPHHRTTVPMNHCTTAC